MEKKYRNDTILLALGLLLICLLSYGISIGQFGYFLDDWYIIWTYTTLGVDKFVEFFKADRPLFSIVYRIIIPIIKDSPLSWQIFAIFTKWLSAISLWALLKLLLPKRDFFTYAISALFAVYPGFKFHHFVVMYGQNYLILSFYLLSYILMIKGLEKTRYSKLFIILGLIFQFIGIAPMELYYGLELMRPIVLFFTFRRDDSNLKSVFAKTARAWLPYFLVLTSFTLFRILFSHLYSYQVSILQNLIDAPIDTLTSLVKKIFVGLTDSLVLVWLEFEERFYLVKDYQQKLSILFLIIVGFLIIYFMLHITNKKDSGLSDKVFPSSMLGIGVFATLTAMIPMIMGGFDIGLSFHNNRFLLPLSIGASMSTIGFIGLLFEDKFTRNGLVAILIALSIGANYANALEFKRAWEDQKSFFAQLSWRVPQLEPSTVLFTTSLPFASYYSGSSLTAPLNMIYAPEIQRETIPYQMILSVSPQMESMPVLIPNQRIDRPTRVFRFIGNTSDSLVVYKPEQGCLKILSSDTDPRAFETDEYYDSWKDIIPLSDLSRIRTGEPGTELPVRYFGNVPTDDWCYYYESAALAEQELNWSKVISIYKEAQTNGYKPEDNSEWLPLVMAYINVGDFYSALKISEELEIDNNFTYRGLCSVWQNDKLNIPAEEIQSVNMLLSLWDCD